MRRRWRRSCAHYLQRWRVEDFFRVLKSGFRMEHLAFRIADRLQRAIAINSVIAWRIIPMTLLGREVPECEPGLMFTDHELHFLADYEDQFGLGGPADLGAAVRLVAHLGGYRAPKHDPGPGHQVMWHGYNSLTTATPGIRLPWRAPVAVPSKVSLRPLFCAFYGNTGALGCSEKRSGPVHGRRPPQTSLLTTSTGMQGSLRYHPEFLGLELIVRFRMTDDGPFIIAEGAINPRDNSGVSPDGAEPFLGQVFFHPGPGEAGSLQRRLFSGPTGFFLDFSVSKSTRITEGQIVKAGARVENLLNHPVFYASPVQLIGSSQFGRISETLSQERRIELFVRYEF